MCTEFRSSKIKPNYTAQAWPVFLKSPSWYVLLIATSLARLIRLVQFWTITVIIRLKTRPASLTEMKRNRLSLSLETRCLVRDRNGRRQYEGLFAFQKRFFQGGRQILILDLGRFFGTFISDDKVNQTVFLLIWCALAREEYVYREMRDKKLFRFVISDSTSNSSDFVLLECLSF